MTKTLQKPKSQLTGELSFAKLESQRDIAWLFNMYADPTASGKEKATIRKLMPDLLNQFEKEDAHNHDLPEWAKPTMRAGWAYALNDWALAIKYDRTALGIAEEARDNSRIARSCRNLSAAYRHLGQKFENEGNTTEANAHFKQAREFGERARRHDPDRIVGFATLVIPYAKTGDADLAEALLSELVKQAKWDDPKDELAARLLIDVDVHELELPSAKKLRDLAKSRRGK